MMHRFIVTFCNTFQRGLYTVTNFFLPCSRLAPNAFIRGKIFTINKELVPCHEYDSALDNLLKMTYYNALKVFSRQERVAEI